MSDNYCYEIVGRAITNWAETQKRTIVTIAIIIQGAIQKAMNLCNKKSNIRLSSIAPIEVIAMNYYTNQLKKSRKEIQKQQLFAKFKK